MNKIKVFLLIIALGNANTFLSKGVRCRVSRASHSASSHHSNNSHVIKNSDKGSNIVYERNNLDFWHGWFRGWLKGWFSEKRSSHNINAPKNSLESTKIAENNEETIDTLDIIKQHLIQTESISSNNDQDINMSYLWKNHPAEFILACLADKSDLDLYNK